MLTLAQPLQGGDGRHRNGRCLLEGEIGWFQHQRTFTGASVLGESAIHTFGDIPEHLIPWLKLGHMVANRFHPPGDIGPLDPLPGPPPTRPEETDHDGSADGGRIAYTRQVVDTCGYALGTRRLWTLDVSSGQTAPLYSDARIAADGPAWSPDGKWLAVTISEVRGSETTENLVALQPDTCQAVPLPGLAGRVTGWK